LIESEKKAGILVFRTVYRVGTSLRERLFCGQLREDGAGLEMIVKLKEFFDGLIKRAWINDPIVWVIDNRLLFLMSVPLGLNRSALSISL
jgi:hypothetical protein